jgi:MFS family permease
VRRYIVFTVVAVALLFASIGASALLFTLVGICGIGHGVATPAANNACIELMPDRVATITGLRGMFRNLGSTLGITFATLILDLISDTQRAYYVVFFAPIALMIISIPTICMMPASPYVEGQPIEHHHSPVDAAVKV